MKVYKKLVAICDNKPLHSKYNFVLKLISDAFYDVTIYFYFCQKFVSFHSSFYIFSILRV